MCIHTVPDTMNVCVGFAATIYGVYHLPDRPDPGEQEHDGDEARVPQGPHDPRKTEHKFK